ncbi:lamin tail domain-containing protein [Lachnospiraceae bacterium ASD3451]|uniref:lamin tail domain-containing protein n=1 Tax=Diplocloster agilis TaxID=2850323 RepID=UPI001E148F42|nr:lamin tail domain-containing protein [Diplocloster agilis]MBU9746876.1 lamin tail domain-containing protein [Diplocloster agilis]
MKRSKRSTWIRALGIMELIIFVSSPIQYAQTANAAETENTVFINEIESDDANGGNDWVEIMNAGETDVNISGWFVSDDKELERLEDGSAWRIAEGTVLEAGAVLVLEDGLNFDFGLGKNDKVVLYDADSQVLDFYEWTGHAAGTYSRVPDGTGEFTDQVATKGQLNITGGEGGEPEPESGKAVINEINSAPDDWVEFINAGTGAIDISGYEIRDNSDDHRWKFPDGTSLDPGELLLVSADTVGRIYQDQTDTYEEGAFQEAIGIGSGDSIRLYDSEGTLQDEYTWTEHASYEGDQSAASYGRYPDGTGSFTLMPETPGQSNSWYEPTVVINEVESNGDATDWAEVYNVGSTPVDLSGWYLLDNDPVGHAADVTPVAEGTVLNPGEYFVFDQMEHFTFGLGKADQVSIYNKDRIMIAEFAWEDHANGVFARIPDGTGEFVDFAVATKGEANIIKNPVVLNEIQSKDPQGGPDWIELANNTGAELDISGIVIKDDNDTHEYVIPEGTKIPANGFIVFTENDFGFGLGKNDRVRLFENDLLIADTTWVDQTNPTWGLYPDVNGKEYRNTKEATPGAANVFDGIPEVIAWPGREEVAVFDAEPTFLEDSSGLDFYNGQLYAVDNGTGTFWILDMAGDGTLTFAKGFENGKRVRFKKDADNASAAGPDAEGISVDEEGYVYIASERDNSAKGVNYNVILKVNPKEEGPDLVALQEWDLTASLTQVAANTGIESVEWVSNKEVTDKLYDQNTNAGFDAENYPDAVADGVFFVALEDNGHVYAYVLNEDGSSVQIADIDSKLGGAMALDYDTYEKVLWVAADNGFGNRAAIVTFTGEADPAVIHVIPAGGVDITGNNEGFAIAEARYTRDGQRPVYRFQDGVKSGALTIGSIACDYKDTTVPVTYPILEGADQTVVQNSDGTAVIRVNADISKFVSVAVDGNTVDGSNYKVTEGSTIVTFTPEYLSALSVGTHTVVINFIDGTAATSLTLSKASEDHKPGGGDHNGTVPDDNNTGTTPAPGDNTGTTPEGDKNSGTDSNTNNDNTTDSTTDSNNGSTEKAAAPDTGDHAPIAWLFVLAAGAGCIAVIFKRKCCSGRKV